MQMGKLSGVHQAAPTLKPRLSTMFWFDTLFCCCRVNDCHSVLMVRYFRMSLLASLDTSVACPRVPWGSASNAAARTENANNKFSDFGGVLRSMWW